MEEKISRLEKQYSDLVERITDEELVKIEYLKSIDSITDFSSITPSKIVSYFQTNTETSNKENFKNFLGNIPNADNKNRFVELLLDNLVHERIIKIDSSGNIKNLENFNPINDQLKDLIKKILNKVKRNLSFAISCRTAHEDIARIVKKNDTYEIYSQDGNLLQIIDMDENKKNQLKQEMKELIISKIVYQSTKDAINFMNVGNEFCIVNNQIYPISIFYEIALEVPLIAERAFNNYYMFLSNNRTIFYDYLLRKYLLRLEDTHIIGMDNTQKFNEKLLKNPELLKEIVSTFNLTSPNFDNPNDIKNLKIYLPKFVSKMTQLDCAMEELKTKVIDGDEDSLQQCIRALNKAQQLLTSIMTNEKEPHQVALLVYFTSLDNDHSIENIKKIFAEKGYYFSNQFIKMYQENPESLKNKLLFALQNNEFIIKKYNRIIEYQKHLSYLNLLLTQKIVNEVEPCKWDSYFGKKYDDKGELDNNKIGSFGLAHLYILYNIEKVLETLSTNNLENVAINIPKNSDKLYFLNVFNYIVDVKKIYVVDRVNNVDSNIICKMDALHTTLLACFEKYNNTTGVAEFFSIQNSEELTFEHDVLVEFKSLVSSEYVTSESLISISEAKKDSDNSYIYSNALSQTQSDFYKKNMNASEIINLLKLDDNGEIKENAIRLRTATSMKVQINPNIPQNEQTMFDKIITLGDKKNGARAIDKNDENSMNIVGSLHAMSWISKLDRSLFEEFTNVQNMSNKQFFEIKTLLTIQNYKVLLSELKIKEQYLTTKRSTERQFEESIKIDAELSRIRLFISELNQDINNLQNIVNNTLNTEEDIENKFNYYKNNFNKNTYYVLMYFAETALELGFIDLSNKIKKYCFNFQLDEEKKLFQSEYEKKEKWHAVRNGAVNQKQHNFEKNSYYYANEESLQPNSLTKRVIELFDNEISSKKDKSLDSISDVIEKIFPGISEEDKIRFIQIADTELSQIIKVNGCNSKQTSFEKEVETVKSNNRTKLETIISNKKNILLESLSKIMQKESNQSQQLEDQDLSPYESMYKLIRIYINDIKTLKEEYSFDANELIEKYYFEFDQQAQKDKYSTKKHDVFDELYEKYCSIEAITELLLNQYKAEVYDLYKKYESIGGYYYDQEVRNIDALIGLGRKKVQFTYALNYNSTIFNKIIWKIYDLLTERETPIRKENIKQYILLRMKEVNEEVNKKTNSKLFAQVDLSTTNDSSCYQTKSTERDNQISRIQYANNPTNSFRI